MANVLEIIVKAKDEASRTLGSMTKNVERFSGQLKAAGIAMTAIGVAGLKVASDARKMNAELGYTGQIIGASAEEMRNMALAITDVTFGVKSVTETFELLARAGVRDQDMMKQNALAFDALADATKSSAEIIADILIPAYKMFGAELPKTAGEMDKWTYLVTTTNVALSDLGGLMGYVATYGQDLNLTAEQLVIMMKAMAEQGRSASDAARLLRTAINQAGGSTEKLYKLLGITNEELELYGEELQNATGITADLQTQQESQYTVLDKLKQKWNEIVLALAPVLEALEPVFSVMTALGPTILGLTYGLPPLVRAFRTLRLALLGVKIQAIAMWGAITLGISLAVTAIIEFISRINAGQQSVEDYDRALQDLTSTMKTDVESAANSMIRNLQGEQTALVTALEERRRLWKEAHWERMSQLTEQFFGELMAISPKIAKLIRPIYENWQKAQAEIKEAESAINRIDLTKAKGELAKLEIDPTASERSIWQLKLNIGRLQLPAFDEQFAEIMKGIEGTDIDTYFNQAIADVHMDYDPLIEQWSTVWKDEFYDWRVDWAANVKGGMLDYDKELDRWIPIYKAKWKEMFPGIEVPELEMPEKPAALPKAYSVFKDLLNLFGFSRQDWDKYFASLGLQWGGIITQPTRAIIGEAGPEAVIPLSQMQTGQFTINVGYLLGDEISLRRFAREIQQILGQESRRTQFGQVNTGYFFGRSSI